MGRKPKKEWMRTRIRTHTRIHIHIHVRITDSLCCTAETNTTLQSTILQQKLILKKSAKKLTN